MRFVPIFLPPASEGVEGNVFKGVCLSTEGDVSQHALGQGVCLPECTWSGGGCIPVYTCVDRVVYGRSLKRAVRILLAGILVNTEVNDFDANKSACHNCVLVVTGLVVSGTQCIYTKVYDFLPALQ